MTVKAAAQQHYMLCICTKILAIAGTALTFHGAGGIIAIWIKPYFVLAAQAHHYILNLEKQCIKRHPHGGNRESVGFQSLLFQSAIPLA